MYYVYAVHDDKESGKDVHIAMTANDEADLEMYPDEIKRERKQAHETYLDRGRQQQQEHDRGRDLESGRGR